MAPGLQHLGVEFHEVFHRRDWTEVASIRQYQALQMNSARGRLTRRGVDAPERARPGATCDELDDIAIYIQMQICHSLMNERLRRALGPHAISNRGYFVMVALRSRPDNLVDSSELCDATGESRGNMTRICDDLVEVTLQRLLSRFAEALAHN